MNVRARLALIALTVVACTSAPEAGEFGTFRFVGRALGAPPLSLLPPVTDRSGNIYVLYGGINVPETVVYAGRAGGGWHAGCALSKGDRFGVHGWVGFDQERQWYWSGDALVAVSGATGDCRRVLDRDPGTDVSLQFKGVLPAVRDAPTRTTLVALVQSAADPVPYSALVDLGSQVLTNVQLFDPADATDVQVIGTGASREDNLGFALVQYVSGGIVLEARFYDADADDVGRVRIASDALPPYSVQGFLHADSSGLVAGLLHDGRLVTFDRRGGRVRDVPGMTPVGVHVWNENLWVVGTANERPVIAPIGGAGAIGGVVEWDASAFAAGELRGAKDVRDDRSLPSRTTTWTTVTTAMGPFPFVTAHSPVQHADGTTLWLVAGPSYDAGGVRVTAFAVAPVGITYP